MWECDAAFPKTHSHRSDLLEEIEEVNRDQIKNNYRIRQCSVSHDNEITMASQVAIIMITLERLDTLI